MNVLRDANPTTVRALAATRPPGAPDRLRFSLDAGQGMFYTTPYRKAPGGCCAPFVPLAGKTNNQERNMNMKTNRKAAVLALGLALLAPLAGAQEVVDSEWWNVNFDGSFQEGFEGLTIGELGALTNNESKGNVVQPYASGVWSALDDDESYVTNEYCQSASGGTNWCLKLDTQGNDLTWTPTNVEHGVTNIYQKIALVDADLYLVGSDSAPDPADFDATADVQSAIFLKNETDEESGETTNSVLCIYVFDGSLNGGQGGNVWRELEGRAKTPTNDIPDNAWYRVTVLIDYETKPSEPMVEVYVDGIKLHARGDEATDQFLAANYADKAARIGCIQSVSFRGTGAIDNFVGKTRKETYLESFFKAVSFLNDTEVPYSADAEDQGLWQQTEKSLRIGKETASFENMALSVDLEDEDTGEFVSYVLSRIEVDDFSTTPKTTSSHRFTYNPDSVEFVELDPDPAHIAIVMAPAMDWETGEPIPGQYVQAGISITNLLTTGATPPANENDAIPIVRLYFEQPPQPGDFTLTATQNVGENPADKKFNANSASLPDSDTFTFQKMIVSEDDVTNVLRRVVVTNAFNVTGAYADDTFTVTVPVAANAAAFADKTINVAQAFYEPGDYSGKAISAVPVGNGVYEIGAWVAKIGETNLYESLRAAIVAAQDNDTIYLVADDRVSFSATATEIGITKTLTIDGGSNTLYGVTDYAYDGHNDHDIYIGGSGNVTIKNLTLSGFSDTAPTVQYRTYPIWTGKAYAGTLVLDGVTVTNYARTAVNLSGGSFLITNCVFAGYADDASPTRYYQDAVVVFNATGTVANTTVTGVGDANTGYGASVFTVNSDGAGEITVKSGSYTGSYIAAVNSNATGRITIEGGTFVATNANGEDGKPDTAFEPANTVGKIVITGGWFNLEPEAEFLAAGYGAEKAKPDTDPAPWTVVLANAFWIGGANGDWNVPANWDIGLVPTKDTVVTFTNDATVGISPTVCKCKEMVLDGANVTIGRADQGTGADLNFYKNAGSAVSGTGTLVLDTVGLFNQNNSGVLTIGTDLDIQGDVTFKGVKDDNGRAGSWTVTGETTIADGVTVKTIDDAITTFQGDIEIDAGSQVTFFAAYGAPGSNHGGEIVVAPTSTVTLASPATKLLLQTRNDGKITINDSQVVTDSPDYYVKKSSQQNVNTGNNGVVNQTTYEVLPKRTVVNVAATDVTVEGVKTGDRFVPGTNFVITVSGFDATGYEPSVMITNGTSVLLTTNAATFTYTAPDSDIGVIATKVAKIFDVIWVVEGSEETNKVAYGETPAYTNGTPERESTVATNFTFAGWTPEITAVTGDATYTATWTETLRKYWISWVVEGTTTSNEVDYGAVPSYGADPEKEGWTFLGWATTEGATEAAYGVGTNLPNVGGAAKYYAVFEENAPEHIGAAASENGFMILSPEDPSQPEAPVFTLAPTMNGLNGTTKISASFVKPEGVTSATVKLVYKKSLAADAQKFYADATITNIDLANGTADVAYTLPQDEDAIFLIGFTDGAPVGNGD